MLSSMASSRDTGGGGGGVKNNPLLQESTLLSPLEQEVLEEYSTLLENMNKLSDLLADLSSRPATQTLDGLRLLERKTATVCTLLKASVYSIVLQQQIYNETEGETSENTARREGDDFDGGAGGVGESMDMDDGNDDTSRY